MKLENYWPFNKEKFKEHIAPVRSNKRNECYVNEDHFNDLRKSIERYEKFLQKHSSRKGMSLDGLRTPCQIERDEKFWISSCLMRIYHSDKRVIGLEKIFKRAFGEAPPFLGIASWKECFIGNLRLFFEPSLPSPKIYKEWLFKDLKKRHFIPYVLDSAEGKKNLEGPTSVDALLVNEGNGFGALIEAKVLSDISYSITYDTMRNQIARNIDVMLEKNENLCHPLDKRSPERTLFLLVTPRLYKENRSSRLYGYKFDDYKNNPQAILEDLPHRDGKINPREISDKIGWLTWEDFNEVHEGACPWLE